MRNPDPNRKGYTIANQISRLRYASLEMTIGEYGLFTEKQFLAAIF